MRPETDACPIGTRGARSRASQVASIGCPVRARGGAEAQRRGRPCILKLVEVEFRSRRRRRDRDRGDRFPSCLHERRCVAAGTVDDAEWLLSHVNGQLMRRGRLPIGETSSISCLRCRPAVLWGCPAVLKGKRGALGGFSRVSAAFLVSLVTSTCTFLKPIFKQLFKRAGSILCGTRLDVVLRVSG